jgi:hypothetical protein
MRVSELLGSTVRTESGEELGRVYDVRVARDPRSSGGAHQKWRLKGLVIGKRGLLERFGIAGARRQEPTLPHDLVPWDAIIRTRAGEIVVKDGTNPL